jgi:hypothetical protein
MTASLKISADTTPIKKSLLDVAKSFEQIKSSKVSIFSSEDKKFLKGELQKEIGAISSKIKSNRDEISKMINEQSKLIDGSEEELALRLKIVDAYKHQATLSKELGNAHQAKKEAEMGDGSTGFQKKIFGVLGTIVAAAATYAITRTIQATNQYSAGIEPRNKLKGLGVQDENFGTPQELARVGLSEQDMVQRRADATATLGRQGTSQDTEMKKAGFERAFGLNSGTMTGVATQFRSTMGGAGATDAQMKLQAATLASGIEDALGPYLDSATKLLSSINDNGATNTEEMTKAFAMLVKDGTRTPEMISQAFAGINEAVKNATGEKSAFLQTAFARAGIGGGTIGGTKFAMESGGIMGLDEEALKKRGDYNPKLLANMKKEGLFKGVGDRTEAIKGMFKEMGGLGKDEKISQVTDTQRMYGMGNVASNILGIKDPQKAFDALLLMEKLQEKQMTKEDFDKQFKDIVTGDKDPVAKRLEDINTSLSGQTALLSKIQENTAQQLGKQGVVAANAAKQMDTEGVRGLTTVGKDINDTGIVKKTGDVVSKGMSFLNDAATKYDKNVFDYEKDSSNKIFDIIDKKRAEKKAEEEGTTKQPDQSSATAFPTAKDIGTEVANAMSKVPRGQPTVVNQIRLPDGKVSENTMKGF